MTRAPSYPDVEFLRPSGLLGVELRYSCYSSSAFRTHTHPAWSVGLMESGSTSFTLSGRAHRATAGDIVVISPGRAHSCNPDPDTTMAYRMFYLAPAWLAPGEPGAAFPAFRDPVIRDRELYEQWLGVWEFLTARDNGAAGAAAAASAAQGDGDAELSAAVGALVKRHGAPAIRAIPPHDLGAVEAAKRVLERNVARRVPLEQLGAEVGMSRSHLSRVFSAAVGLPPHTYQNQVRIERGKQMLAEGGAPADVSSALGFSDQAHFSRVFREFTGATPLQYQSGTVDPSESAI